MSYICICIIFVTLCICVYIYVICIYACVYLYIAVSIYVYMHIYINVLHKYFLKQNEEPKLMTLYSKCLNMKNNSMNISLNVSLLQIVQKRWKTNWILIHIKPGFHIHNNKFLNLAQIFLGVLEHVKYHLRCPTPDHQKQNISSNGSKHE